MMKEKLSNLLQIRLLDDILYQSIVRPWAVKMAKTAGVSIHQLGTHTEEIQQEVDTAMQKLWIEVCKFTNCPTQVNFALNCPGEDYLK